MGYKVNSSPRAGTFADTQDLTLKGSGAETASTNGSAFELGDRRVARLLLSVTAASGTTPNLTVTVQCSADGVTWYTSGTFTAATTTTTERKLFMLDRFVRYSSAITGTTPSFTYSVSGETV